MALTGAVGAINVKVSADATGFNASMNKVGAKVASTAKAVRSSANTYAKWGVVAAAAGVAVGVSMVKSQMQVLDALAKTSDALGVQQKQLQALQHVAELTGTGAAQLSVNLERMQRRIGEVARKGGQAAAALEEIGVSASDMINLPADQQLVKISQAMQGVTNSSIKASIAMDLFGRDGVRMLKMMEQLGKDGIAPTVAELEALGVSLSRLDTAKVEQANDALFRMKQVTDGVVNQIAVKLSPLITQIGEDFLNSAKEGEGFGATIDSVMSGAVTVVGVFADSLHGLKITFKAIEIASKTMGLLVAKVMEGVAKSIEALVNISINGTNKLVSSINDITGVGLPLIEKFELSATKAFTDLANNGEEQLSKLIDEIAVLSNPINLPSNQFDAFIDKANKAATAAAEAATSMNAGGETGGGGGADLALTNEERSSLQDRVDAISQSLKSESKIRSEALTNNLNDLKIALDNSLIKEADYNKKVKDLKKQAADETAAENAPNLESIQTRLDAVSKGIMSESELRSLALNNDVQALKDALNSKLIEESEYIEKVKALKQQAAEEVTVKKDDDLAKIQSRLDAVQQGLMTETELKRVALENDLLILKESLANKLLTQEEHDQQLIALVGKTSGSITAIEDRAKKDRDNLAQAEKSAKINAVSQTFGGLSTLMNTESKKLFAIGKAAAIAGAVVDGYAAVSKTMASAPYPLNIGLAAAQGVASAVQIQGIAKQKIGGAQSMGATASFSGGTPTTNTSGGAGGMGGRNISIAGLDPSSMFSGDQVRDLLKNMAGDGADFTFLTSGG